MRRMLAKRSNFCLFLAAVTLFGSFVVKAQNNSAVNLGGVLWQTDEVDLPPSVTGDTGGSVTIAKRVYYFHKEDKFTAITVFSKSGGIEGNQKQVG